MFKHLIKLIWNKKRSNFLLTTEIFASFLVLFGVLSLVFFNYGNYAEPLGYRFERVWAIDFNNQELSDSLFREALARAQRQIGSYPEVEIVSRCSNNTPFSMNTWNSDVHYEDRSALAEFLTADQHFAAVLDIQMREGRWIDEAEVKSGQAVAVINEPARKLLFGDEPALGKKIRHNDQHLNVVGVIGNFKTKGEFQTAGPTIFINHAAHNSASSMLVKTKPSADAEFEARMVRELGDVVKGANLQLSYLTDQRRNQHNLVKVPMLIAGIVCTFLLLNVALGLFGVLWYNVRKRREEIGLRRALGATHTGIVRHFVGEALVIAAFGIVIGLFFALQLPLLDVFELDKSIYFQSIFASILILALLVGLCSLYPSRQAATVQPAEVLHEE